MKAVIVVAPAGARWADRAVATLTAEGLHVARIPDASAVGFLAGAVGVGAVLFDRRSLRPSWPELRARLQVIARRARFLIVREDDTEDTGDAIAWPADAAAALTLLGDAMYAR